MPEDVFIKIDTVRDAIITYIPGYDRKDFDVLSQALEWIDNIEETLCVRNTKST